MKRFTAVLLLLFWLPAAARADGGYHVNARAACLLDAASGRILFEQNALTRYPMASTTKIMTCLLALETCDPAETVTAGRNASGVPGTSIYLSEGEQLSLRDMLYGLMLRSGNDAAVAIAEHVSGSVSEFAAKMNARAAELGADAVFVNPHGLPAEGHAASAYAMTQIAREALRIPLFREIVSTRRATIPWQGNDYSRVLNNKNRLLAEYEGATGIKTGYTKAAGRCLVFSAERSGMELIGCVLNCPNWFSEAEDLLDYGFAQYHPVTALKAGDTAARIRVAGARNPELTLVAAQDAVLPLLTGETFSVRMEAADARAPILPGDILGSAVVSIGDAEFMRIPLISPVDVPEWGLLPALRHILNRFPLLR